MVPFTATILFLSRLSLAAPAPDGPVTAGPVHPSLATCGYRAVLIAVKDYQNEDLADLVTPEADVRRIAGVLRDTYGFTLEGPDDGIHLNVTSDQIRDVLKKLTVEGAVAPCESVVVYFAGHGKRDRYVAQGYWYGADSDPQDTHTQVSNTQVRDYLDQIPARNVLLVVDACFAGGLFASEGRSRRDAFGWRALTERRSRWVISSGRDEPVTDAPFRDTGTTAFAHFLASALQDASGQQLVESDLLLPVIAESFRRHKLRQIPVQGWIGGVDHEEGMLVFATRGRSGRLLDHPRPTPKLDPRPTPTRTALYAGGIASHLGATATATLEVRLVRTTGYPDLALSVGGGGGFLTRPLANAYTASGFFQAHLVFGPEHLSLEAAGGGGPTVVLDRDPDDAPRLFGFFPSGFVGLRSEWSSGVVVRAGGAIGAGALGLGASVGLRFYREPR